MIELRTRYLSLRVANTRNATNGDLDELMQKIKDLRIEDESGFKLWVESVERKYRKLLEVRLEIVNPSGKIEMQETKLQTFRNMISKISFERDSEKIWIKEVLDGSL